MRATLTYRGHASKRVLVEGIPTDRHPISDDMVIGFAMAAVGESPNSLFGWSSGPRALSDNGRTESATVTLNTD